MIRNNEALSPLLLSTEAYSVLEDDISPEDSASQVGLAGGFDSGRSKKNLAVRGILGRDVTKEDEGSLIEEIKLAGWYVKRAYFPARGVASYPVFLFLFLLGGLCGLMFDLGRRLAADKNDFTVSREIVSYDMNSMFGIQRDCLVLASEELQSRMQEGSPRSLLQVDDDKSGEDGESGSNSLGLYRKKIRSEASPAFDLGFHKNNAKELVLIYGSEKGGNLFTKDNLEWIRQTENALMRATDSDLVCESTGVNRDVFCDDFVLSPTKMFFASAWDQELCASVIERIRISWLVEFYNFLFSCADLSRSCSYACSLGNDTESPMRVRECENKQSNTYDILNFDFNMTGLDSQKNVEIETEGGCPGKCFEGPCLYHERKCDTIFDDYPQSHVVEASNLFSDIHTLVQYWEVSGDKVVDDIEQMAVFMASLKKLHIERIRVDFLMDKLMSEDYPVTAYTRSVMLMSTWPRMVPLEDGGEYGIISTDWVGASHGNKILREYEFSDDGGSKMYYLMGSLIDEFISNVILSDALYATGSVVIVFFFLYLQTQSLFLGASAMIQIILAPALAWYFYRYVFGIQYFGALNVLAAFIACAVGVDDIFVFLEMWKVSVNVGPGVNLNAATRFQWVWKKAAWSTMVTSLTTCISFFSSCMIPMVSTCSFGIFAGLAILFDYFLVITLFAVAMMVYHSRWEGRGKPWVPSCSLRKSGKTTTERVLQMYCDRRWTAVKSEVGTMQQARLKNDEESRRVLGTKGMFMARTKGGIASGQDEEDNVEEHTTSTVYTKPVTGKGFVSKHFVADLFENILYRLISYSHFRILLLIIVCVWIVVCLQFALDMQISDTSMEFLRDDHRLQKAAQITMNEFGISGALPGAQVFIVWGLFGVDRSGVNFLSNPDFRGEAMYHPQLHGNEGELKMNSDECHIAVLEQCRKLQTLAYGGDDIDDRFSRVPGYVRGDIQGRPLVTCIEKSGDINPGDTDGLHTTGFDGEDWHFVGMIFESNVFINGVDYAEKVVRPFYDQFVSVAQYLDEDGEVRDKCGIDGGGGVALPWVVEKKNLFVFMHTQSQFLTNLVSGILTGIGIAFFVVFLSTRSIVMGVFTVITVLMSILSVSAVLGMMGWKIGVVECVLYTVLSGFSVDYVLHVSVAYVMAQKKLGKRERVLHALRETGPVSLNGMISSMLGVIPMFFCELLIFEKFAIFLIFTVFFSWFFSNFILSSLLIAFGSRFFLGPSKLRMWG